MNILSLLPSYSPSSSCPVAYPKRHKHPELFEIVAHRIQSVLKLPFYHRYRHTSFDRIDPLRHKCFRSHPQQTHNLSQQQSVHVLRLYQLPNQPQFAPLQLPGQSTNLASLAEPSQSLDWSNGIGEDLHRKNTCRYSV